MKIEKYDRREKTDQIINHAVLSLDFWQDTVIYEGCAMPTGTIGCEVLNIPDSVIQKLDSICYMLNQLLHGMNTGSVDMELLPQVQQAAGKIIFFLQATPPFYRLDRSYLCSKTGSYLFRRIHGGCQSLFAAHPAGATNLCFDWSARQGNHARPNRAGDGAFKLFSGAIQQLWND